MVYDGIPHTSFVFKYYFLEVEYKKNDLTWDFHKKIKINEKKNLR